MDANIKFRVMLHTCVGNVDLMKFDFKLQKALTA